MTVHQNSPALSLVVPVCNGAEFLPQLLDSVLAQSAGDWQCICVDDGSSDESPRILGEYAAKDARFLVVTQANAGCGAARNRAMELAAAPLLMFADQDDLLHPQAFETARAAADAAGCDCLMFGFRRFSAPPAFEKIPSFGEIRAEPRNGTDLITGRRDSWPIFVWRHVFRTAAVAKVPFPPISGGEDQAWMSELSWNGLSWASIEPALYFNRDRPGSRSRGVSKRYVQNVLASYDWIAERSKLYGVDPAWVRRFTGHMKLMFRLSLLYRRLAGAGFFLK